MVAPYSALAAGYDAVMAHVDYPAWADYTDALLREHGEDVRSVIEIGCGTGALAVALQPYGPPPVGFVYRGYDGSEAMVAVARERAQRAGRSIPFAQADFRDPIPGPPADAVLLLYDGLNYLLDAADVATLLVHVHDALVPGGVAVIDQSTPTNSLTHADGFDDAGDAGAFRYLRTSRYDAEARLHTTEFTLTSPTGARVTETHVQRAYGLGEVRDLIRAGPFREVAAYDGFSLDPATEESERVHWVLQRPTRGAGAGRP